MILAVTAGELLAAGGAFVTGLASLIVALTALISAAAKASHEIHEEWQEHHDQADAERDQGHR
jgi:hypothetical protein